MWIVNGSINIVWALVAVISSSGACITRFIVAILATRNTAVAAQVRATATVRRTKGSTRSVWGSVKVHSFATICAIIITVKTAAPIHTNFVCARFITSDNITVCILTSTVAIFITLCHALRVYFYKSGVQRIATGGYCKLIISCAAVVVVTTTIGGDSGVNCSHGCPCVSIART